MTHPILAAYDTHLRSKVHEALACIPWQTIDIVRIGFVDNHNSPPVVLVTVKEEDADNLVQAVVDQIWRIMVEQVLAYTLNHDFADGCTLEMAS